MLSKNWLHEKDKVIENRKYNLVQCVNLFTCDYRMEDLRGFHLFKFPGYRPTGRKKGIKNQNMKITWK